MQVYRREMMRREGSLIGSTRLSESLLCSATDRFRVIEAAHVDQRCADLVVGERTADVIVELDRELPRLAHDGQRCIVLSGSSQDLPFDVGRAGQQRAGSRRTRGDDGFVDVLPCRIE